MNDETEIGRLVRESLPHYEAPPSLHEWARAQARQQESRHPVSTPETLPLEPRRRVSPPMRRLLYAASLLIAATLGWGGHLAMEQGGRSSDSRSVLETALVDAHVRSLMLDHLMDVRSTDRHTVKPWFAGKIDFSPRVVDLASVGFPLLGGRVDYVQRRVTAVLVYGRQGHIVNLFMWPQSEGNTQSPIGVETGANGYSVTHWAADGMSYWAVSDAAPAELAAFRQAYSSSS